MAGPPPPVVGATVAAGGAAAAAPPPRRPTRGLSSQLPARPLCAASAAAADAGRRSEAEHAREMDALLASSLRQRIADFDRQVCRLQLQSRCNDLQQRVWDLEQQHRQG
eukprot:gene38202-15838_t